MKLSKRLESLIALVPPHTQVLDVGCDHGYVSIELVRRGIAECAVASDLRPGPLSAAEQHIREASLCNRISTECCDGIPKDFIERFHGMGYETSHTVCLISGMGGLLMRDILRKCGNNLAEIKTFILSPQSDLYLFRRECMNLELRIEDETILKEDGKFYVLIKAEGGPKQNMTECELRYGPVLLKKRDVTLKEYLMTRQNTFRNILSGLKAQNTERSRERSAEVLEELACLEEALGVIG